MPASRRSRRLLRRRPPAGPARCRRRSARRWRCGCACSTPATDKYGLNAWIFDSTNDGTTNYDKVLFSRTKSAADSVGILRKGEWADVKVKIVGGALRRPHRRHARQGRGADRQPVARPALPHVRQPRDRELADVARRARLHRRLRRVPRAEVPDLDGRGLRDPRGRRHVRGDVRRAGPVLEDRSRADARVRRREVRPGPAPRRHADDGRVPAPVPRARLAEAAERRREPGLRRRRPERRRRTAAWPPARRSSAPRTRRRTRS